MICIIFCYLFFFNFIICAFFKVPGRFRGVPGGSGWFRAVPGRFRHLHTPSPFRKHSVLFFSAGLPRTVCAFVSLTRNNMIEQYINTFLEMPRPNVIQTASHCCFEKFRINRYPNRPSLDYPLDLTKLTNYKINKRKWT